MKLDLFNRKLDSLLSQWLFLSKQPSNPRTEQKMRDIQLKHNLIASTLNNLN